MDDGADGGSDSDQTQGCGKAHHAFPYSSARVARAKTLAGRSRHQQEQHWTMTQTNEAVTHLLEPSYDILTVQEFLGHSDVRTR